MGTMKAHNNMGNSATHGTSAAVVSVPAAGTTRIQKLKGLSPVLALPVAVFSLFEKVPLVVRAPLSAACLLGCCLYIIRAKDPSRIVATDGKHSYSSHFFPNWTRFAAWALISIGIVYTVVYLLHMAAAFYFTPQLHKFHPDRVTANDSVEFTGTRFPKDLNALRILFGESEAEQIELHEQTVRVTVPTGAAQPVRIVVSTGLPWPFKEFEKTVPIEVSGQAVTFLAERVVTKGRVIAIRFSLINTSDEREVTITGLTLMVIESLPTLSSFRGHREMLGSFKVTLSKGTGITLRDDSTPLLEDGDVYKLPPRQADSFQLSIEAPEEEHGVRFAFTFFANYFTDQGLRSTVFCDQTFHAVCSDLTGCSVRSDNQNVYAAGGQSQ